VSPARHHVLALCSSGGNRCVSPATAEAVPDLVRYQGGLFGCLTTAEAVIAAMR
jgi:hypothetical protein